MSGHELDKLCSLQLYNLEGLQKPKLLIFIRISVLHIFRNVRNYEYVGGKYCLESGDSIEGRNSDI